jgi:hypothetical protein
MTGPRESRTLDPSGFPNWVFLIGAPFMVGYTGDDAINGLSPSNFWDAMKAGWVALAISVTVTLATFATLPANKKYLTLLPALLAPAFCGFAFLRYVAMSLG